MTTKSKAHETPETDPLDALESLAADAEATTPEAAGEATTPAVSAPASTGEIDAQSDRAERCCSILEGIEVDRQTFIQSGLPIPSDALLDGIEDLMLAVAADPFTPWLASSWKFLELASKVASEIEKRLPDWRSPTTPWGDTTWELLGKAHAEVDTLRNPPGPPQPKIVALETLEELDELKVRDVQIAKIYDWTTPDGRPDVGRVKKARAGEIETPTQKEFPPVTDGPQRQPHLGIVDSLAAQFEVERRAAREQAQLV